MNAISPGSPISPSDDYYHYNKSLGEDHNETETEVFFNSRKFKTIRRVTPTHQEPCTDSKLKVTQLSWKNDIIATQLFSPQKASDLNTDRSKDRQIEFLQRQINELTEEKKNHALLSDFRIKSYASKTTALSEELERTKKTAKEEIEELQLALHAMNTKFVKCMTREDEHNSFISPNKQKQKQNRSSSKDIKAVKHAAPKHLQNIGNEIVTMLKEITEERDDLRQNLIMSEKRFENLQQKLSVLIST